MENSTLGDQIKTCLSQNKSKEEIYRELLTAGKTLTEIEAGFALVQQAKHKEDTQQKTVRLILTFGAILVGAGIFSFIAANWQEMAKSHKVALILTALVSSYGAGWYLKEKLGLVRAGEALIILGALIYGGGIFLVGQMFNIRGNWPDAFVLWMVGVAATGYALDFYPLYYLAIIKGFIAIVGRPTEIFSGRFSSFAHTASWLVLVAAAVCFWLGWTIKKAMTAEQKDRY